MIPSFLLQKEDNIKETKAVRSKMSFIDRTMKNVASFVNASFYKWYSSNKKGLLQSTDARVKVLFMFVMVIIAGTSRKIEVQGVIFIFVSFLYLLSRVNFLKSLKSILFIGFFFGFLVFVPASLNIFSKGKPFLTLFHFSREYHWWVYSIPKEIAITKEGTITVARLTFKVINSLSIVILITSTTTFERIVTSLASFRVPGIFLITLTMSYKFIFVLSQTIEESYLALKMRWWSRGSVDDAEKIVSGRVGYLFRKSWERYEMVYQAMVARGFDNIEIFYKNEKLKTSDYLFISFTLLFICFIVYLNIFYG